MPDTSDRPFGHHTLKLRVLFVPEGSEDQISRADIIDAVGSGPLKIPAVLAAEGEARPDRSFVHVGQFVFRPDPGATAGQTGSDTQPQLQQPAEQPGDAQSRVVLPPNPAASLGNGDSFAAGMAAWRRMPDMAGGLRRRSMAPGPSGKPGTKAAAVLPAALPAAVPPAALPPCDAAGDGTKSHRDVEGASDA